MKFSFVVLLYICIKEEKFERKAVQFLNGWTWQLFLIHPSS